MDTQFNKRKVDFLLYGHSVDIRQVFTLNWNWISKTGFSKVIVVASLLLIGNTEIEIWKTAL